MKWPWQAKARPPQMRAPGAFLSGFAGNTGARGYEAQARAAYLGNPVAQRAVRIVAEGAAGAPVTGAPGGHPALALLGQSEGGPPLMETVAANLLLHGNAYVEVGLGADGLPAALWALRPERVAEDRMDVSLASWRTGDLPSAPLVEVRED